MNLHHLVFDIETIPNPDVDAKERSVQEDGRRYVPPAQANVVVAISKCVVTNRSIGPVESLMGDGSSDGSDEALVREFVDLVHNDDYCLVTWAGRFCDLPILIARCNHYGIPAPRLHRAMESRYKTVDHIDLCDLMGFFGSTPKPKLIHAAQNIGLPGKMGIDGSMVEDMYDAGRIEEIRQYCCVDVFTTTAVLVRWLLTRGDISKNVHNMLMEDALSGVSGWVDAVYVKAWKRALLV